ncbi:MAG: ABC transporter substrate-binding protein [Candidatus Thorarchaeota archaeon]
MNKKIISITIIFSMILSFNIRIQNSFEKELPIFFNLTIFSPASSTGRSAFFVEQFCENLKLIGIDGKINEASWAQISPRTWGYPGPYPVPTYDEGGFDILRVGWSWDLDWDPTGLFDTAGITPNGDNFYQYSNPEMDWAIGNYTQSFVLADRIKWCGKIQDILYEDLPEICIIYPLSVYPHVDGFTGWSGLLWALEYQPMENWEIPGQTDFHYATPADFEDFHPMLRESVYDAQWLHQIYNGLVERNSTLSNGYGPKLAEYFTSIDGLTYNIELKNTAVWADGTPLTVDDVIYNYQLAVTPDLGGIGYLAYIKHWDNNSTTKINDYEMVIEFKTPYVFQDGNVGLDLIPKHIWESVAPEDHAAQAVEWATNHPEKILGAGPFMLEEYDPTNGVIHLTANPHFADWYGTAPKFDDVYFEFYGSKEGALAALAVGEIDMVDAQFSAQLDELDIPGTTYTLVEDPGTQTFGINMYHPYLGTGELCPIAGKESAKYIRKALSYLVPREEIISNLGGLAQLGITGCPSVAVGFNKSLEPVSFSIHQAKHYMQLAGFEYNESEVYVSTFFVANGLIINVIFIEIIGFIYFLRKKKNRLRCDNCLNHN